MAEASSFQTVEALATKIADHIIGADSVNFVNVSVEKPSAISFVAGSGCEVNRERNDGDHHAQVNSGPRVSLMYDDVAPSAPEEQE